MMKLHLFLNVFQLVILYEEASSGMVAKERGAIQNFMIVQDQNFSFLLSVGLDLF